MTPAAVSARRSAASGEESGAARLRSGHPARSRSSEGRRRRHLQKTFTINLTNVNEADEHRVVRTTLTKPPRPAGDRQPQRVDPDGPGGLTFILTNNSSGKFQIVGGNQVVVTDPNLFIWDPPDLRHQGDGARPVWRSLRAGAHDYSGLSSLLKSKRRGRRVITRRPRRFFRHSLAIPATLAWRVIHFISVGRDRSCRRPTRSCNSAIPGATFLRPRHLPWLFAAQASSAPCSP